MAKGRIGTWVQETVDLPVQASKKYGLKWAFNYGTDNTWTEGFDRHIFLNSKAELAHNDGTAMANFVCEHKKIGDGGDYGLKPLVKSLLWWQ